MTFPPSTVFHAKLILTLALNSIETLLVFTGIMLYHLQQP